MANQFLIVGPEGNRTTLPLEAIQTLKNDVRRFHTFPESTWNAIPTLKRQKFEIEAALRDFEALSSSLSNSSRDGNDLSSPLNAFFDDGKLLWPYASDGKELSADKSTGGLQKLLNALDQRRKGNVLFARLSDSQLEQIARSIATAPHISRVMSDLETAISEGKSIADLGRKQIAALEERTRDDRRALLDDIAARMTGLNEHQQRSEAVLREDRERANQELSALRTEYSESQKKILMQMDETKATLEGWLAEKQSEINGAKEALKVSFATDEAHTYWAKTKFDRHTGLAKRMMNFGRFYLATVFVGIVVFLCFGSHFNQPIWQTPLSIVVPIMVFLVCAIWVGRLLVRTYMAHVQLAEDAQERATMIETYIALIRADVIDKSKADEAQRMIFRPAASGLLAGDGGPDTPIEVVTKAISGGRS